MAVQAEGSLHFANTMSNTGLLAGSKDAVGIVQRMAQSIARINPFVGLSVVALAAFAKISAGAYKVARDFEKAMKEVETISGATQENFDKMAQAIFDMSKVSVDSPKELAEAYYQIASAGYDGAAGLTLLEQATKSAIAGVTDTATAADVLTTILNAYQLEASEAERVSDILFNTVKLGKTTMEELASSLNLVAPIAAATGISFEEISAAAASLTKRGVPTAQAMTQIRASIVALNENMADGWSEVYTLQEAMQVLYDRAGGSQNKLKEFVGRVEAMNGILSIAGPNAKSAADDLKTFENVVGSTEQATRTMLEANENQWQIFGNRITAYTKSIGDGWLEISTSIAKSLNYMTREMADSTTEVTKQAAQFQILRGELEGVNTTQERRLEILKEIQQRYPEYLGSLDLDEVTNEELNGILEKVAGTLDKINKLTERRIELAGIVDRVTNLSAEEAAVKGLYEKELSEFYIAIERAKTFALTEGIELNIDLSQRPEDIYRQIFNAFKGGELSLGEALFGEKSDIIGDLFEAKEGAAIYQKQLGGITEELQKQNEFLAAQKVALLDNAEGAAAIEAEINKVTRVDDLAQYEGFKTKSIKDALDARRTFLQATSEIRQISLEAYKEDSTLFQKYIANENKEISKLAKERQEKFEKFLSGGGGKTDTEKFVTNLDKTKKAFDQVVALRKKGYYEDAENLRKSLKLQENTFNEYIENRLKTVKDPTLRAELIFRLPEPKETFVDYRRILNLDNFKTDFEEEVEGPILGLKKVFEDTLSDLSFDSFLEGGLDLPTPSEENRREFVGAYERAFGELSDFAIEFGGTLENVQRTAVEQLEVYAKEGKNVFRDMSTAQLQHQKALRQQAIKELKDSDDPLDLDKIKSYTSEIKDITTAMLKAPQYIIGQVVEGLRGAAELFDKFGNEHMSELLNQLAGVGEGVQEMMKGNFVGGAFKIINSAITVDVEADTEKFQKAIDKLQVNIEKLSRDIADSIGRERIQGRIDLLEEQVNVQEQLALAVEAEENARRRVQVLGLTIGRKGRGSGTDQEKLAELQDQADELEHTLVDIENQIKELLTGTTSQSITDSIIKGFEDGYSTIEDFGQTFEDIMKKALINALKVQFLEEAIAPFFNKFAEFSDSNNDGIFDLTAQEIRTLKTQFTGIVQNANAQLDAFNEIANEAGLAGGLFGQGGAEDPNSLSGAIQAITQDTAEVLAGTLNAIRIDTRRGLEVAEESLEQLKQIEENTRYNRRLESIDNHLDGIETALS